MKDFKIRSGFDVTITARDGWEFDFTSDGKMIICHGDLALHISRDEIITEIFHAMIEAVRNNTACPWYITSTRSAD